MRDARDDIFAIISHPDAGKTTLTEHLPRAGGAIQLAGNVRAKGERRRTRFDWMGIERERCISVVPSLVTHSASSNPLDPSGHGNFAAVMAGPEAARPRPNEHCLRRPD
jgi:peptide chain release factor 3